MALTEWKDGSETPLKVKRADVDDGAATVVRPMDPTSEEEDAVEYRRHSVANSDEAEDEDAMLQRPGLQQDRSLWI